MRPHTMYAYDLYPSPHNQPGFTHQETNQNIIIMHGPIQQYSMIGLIGLGLGHEAVAAGRSLHSSGGVGKRLRSSQ
jgi:hypothetical protein